ncbi:MAG: site-2 protease family protein [Chloroflexi bacterium]|nr:site-2 protease family protein [Chloroflexota bacterium]MBU1746495.1 site-2 protease family protein [Chloroflexota bacterium]
MSWSIKIATVKGIDIRIHLTFLLILLWAAFNWGIARPGGWPGMVYGVTLIVLVFACVVLHELAHSLLAQSFGVRVRGITLLPIGGVAQMESVPQRPVQELLMAAAGPAINLALSAVLLVLAMAVGSLSGLPMRTPQDVLGLAGALGPLSLLVELALANVALAAFNLAPAFPMDGGRVLRAVLALALPYEMATQIAVAVGQGLALLLGLWGFFQGDLLLVLIAVFVYLGAEQEGNEVRVQSTLRGMQACHILSRDPLVLAPDTTLGQALDLTPHGHQIDFPVLQTGQLAGILTREGLLQGLRERDPATPVQAVMHTEYPTAVPTATLAALRRQMIEGGWRVVAIIDQGRFVGLLTLADIGEAFMMLSATRHAHADNAPIGGCERPIDS